MNVNTQHAYTTDCARCQSQRTTSLDDCQVLNCAQMQKRQRETEREGEEGETEGERGEIEKEVGNGIREGERNGERAE